MKTVSDQAFLEALKQEENEMARYGTPWRHKTAGLSLQVYTTFPNVDLYRDRQKAYEMASNVLTGEDEERLLDVAQALNALLMCMEHRLNANEELLAHLEANSFTLMSVEELDSSEWNVYKNY